MPDERIPDGYPYAELRRCPPFGTGENPDEAKIRLYCDGSVEQYDWLVGHGVPFKQTYYHGTSGEPPTDGL